MSTYMLKILWKSIGAEIIDIEKMYKFIFYDRIFFAKNAKICTIELIIHVKTCINSFVDSIDFFPNICVSLNPCYFDRNH